MPNIQHLNLTAGAVTTVTADTQYSSVEVLSRAGTAEIYFTVDGVTAPTLYGVNNYVLVAAISSRDVTLPQESANNSIVKMFSTSSCPVSVTFS